MELENIAWYQEKVSKNVLGYVPSMVIKYHMQEGLLSKVIGLHQPSYPVEKEIETVVMFADVSGFTMLSEKLQSRGTEVN
jgi:hypothetical protein